MTEAAFEVLDALDGFSTLVRRSPTMDGAVPLRVAQACVPLLEGNAFGFQVTLTSPLFVRRRLGRITVTPDPPSRAGMERMRQAAVPRLVAQGFIPAGTMTPRLAWIEGPGFVRIWTGLVVRPLAGLRLRVASAANRRNRMFAVRESWIPPGEAFVPLIVDLSPRADCDEIRLEGEIACLSAHPAQATVSVGDLEDDPDLGRAHAGFYDPAYFETKRGEVTRKYRHLAARERAPKDRGPGEMRVAKVGPAAFDVGPGHAVFRNAVSFTARFDGHTLTVDPDRRALEAGAGDVERSWARTFGEDAVARDRRALWYLTKYFTPHPPGEPHFFVKPWAFVRTPPGWSTLLEGIHGEGYDVLRGIVSTDVFHATPAVFALHGTGVIRVPAGTPLMHLFPMPRWLLSAPARAVSWKDACRAG